MSSQLLTGPRAHSQLGPPRGSGPCALRPQDLCCRLGCSLEGVGPQVIEEAEPTQPPTTPHPNRHFLVKGLSFSCPLPGGGRYESLVGALASGREASGTFVTLLVGGSPWSAVMAHVWWVCVTSFLLMCCDSSHPHPLEQHSPS